jgi:hypothetical protein
MINDPDNVESTILYHLSLGREKSISYLPIDAIKHHLGMPVEQFTDLAGSQGLSFEVVSHFDSPVRSGTVHLFHKDCLSTLLLTNQTLLKSIGWPSDAVEFVNKIAREWFADNHPAMSIVRQAFGDQPSCSQRGPTSIPGYRTGEGPADACSAPTPPRRTPHQLAARAALTSRVSERFPDFPKPEPPAPPGVTLDKDKR